MIALSFLFPHFYETMIILAVVLIIFGPRNLPKLGAMLGKAIGSFREGVTKAVDAEPDDKQSPPKGNHPEG